MQERLDGRAASKVGAFGAIHGHFRVSRGLWRRNRLRNEQAFQARRQWNTCLYSLSLLARETLASALREDGSLLERLDDFDELDELWSTSEP